MFSFFLSMHQTQIFISHWVVAFWSNHVYSKDLEWKLSGFYSILIAIGECASARIVVMADFVQKSALHWIDRAWEEYLGKVEMNKIKKIKIKKRAETNWCVDSLATLSILICYYWHLLIVFAFGKQTIF